MILLLSIYVLKILEYYNLTKNLLYKIETELTYYEESSIIVLKVGF